MESKSFIPLNMIAMKSYLLFALISLLCLSGDGGPTVNEVVSFNSSAAKYDESEITGYHFHAYYFQDDNESKHNALIFRRQIQAEIIKGVLQGCCLDDIYARPVGPHPIGSWATCCNSSALSRGVSWFMQNRGNHSVLLHPLTRYEVIDHTSRAMFLGPSLFLNTRALSDDLGEPDKCLPMPYPKSANVDVVGRGAGADLANCVSRVIK